MDTSVRILQYRIGRRPILRRPPCQQPTASRAVRVLRGVTAAVSRHRTICLFVVFLILADWLIGRSAAVWDRHSPDDYAARVNGCRSRPRDLVTVGGSPVAEGFDPEQMTGIDWPGGPLTNGYALGLSGGTTSDVYHAVLRACPTPPRVLVYGITASDLNDARNEPHGPYSLMTPGDVADWVRLRPDAVGWVVRHYLQAQLGRASNLWRHRHGMRMWAATEADRIVPGSCPDAVKEADELREYADALRDGNGYAPLKGFRTGDYAAKKAAGKAPTAFPFLDRYRTGSHLKYLHKLIDWSTANHVALVLVDMPVTAELEAMHPAAFAEYRDRLAEVERDRGVTVIRASRQEVGLLDGHFADLIHLNPVGARVLSRWVRGRLERVRPVRAAAAGTRGFTLGYGVARLQRAKPLFRPKDWDNIAQGETLGGRWAAR
jgi:hypothetical protein